MKIRVSIKIGAFCYRYKKTEPNNEIKQHWRHQFIIRIVNFGFDMKREIRDLWFWSKKTKKSKNESGVLTMSDGAETKNADGRDWKEEQHKSLIQIRFSIQGTEW